MGIANNPFISVMSDKSIEDLLRIVYIDSILYQELAVLAAKEEILKRDLDEEELDGIKNKLFEFQKIKERVEDLSATKKQRFLNFIIDSIIMIISAVVIFAAVKNLPIRLFYKCLFPALPYFLNYIYLENTYQKSIGKFITKTKVVTEIGDKPSKKQIYQRAFYRLIPWEPFTFLHSYYKDSRFHDTMTGTKVIKDIYNGRMS